MKEGRSSIIIDKLIDMVENGQNVTFSSGKVAVNRDETVVLLKELRSIVSGELKVYREVNDRKGRIINEAKKEAEDIIYEAEQAASRIRVTKRMSQIGSGFRADDLDADEKQALRTAHDIYAASVIYTDEMLTEVTDVVAEAYDIINNQYGRMVSVLEEKAKLIADNKAELMSGLRELSKEDRYSQIMELSQLLSNELYNEKNRQRDIEEFEARQLEVQPEEDSAFAESAAGQESGYDAGYEAELDSAFAESAVGQDAGYEAGQGTGYEAEQDSAFAESAAEQESGYDVGYEAELDSALAEHEAKQDSAFAEKSSEHEAESDSAFIKAVGREIERKSDIKTDKNTTGRPRDIYVSSSVEKRILETTEVNELDPDGVKVLRPVNQFKEKRDPVANTLNMLRKNSKNDI